MLDWHSCLICYPFEIKLLLLLLLLLYDIIAGTLRFSQGFSTKCIGYNTNSTIVMQLHRKSRRALIQIVL